MKKLTYDLLLFAIFLISGCTNLPMKNDPSFDPNVESPFFTKGSGPKILIDGGHNNAFVDYDLIEPFIKVARLDGYTVDISKGIVTSDLLSDINIFVIITANSFKWGKEVEISENDEVFTSKEIEIIYNWVYQGGSLLVFSEHAPFDGAINPLLQKFNIYSSIGVIIDTVHFDKDYGFGSPKFSIKNGLLNDSHQIVNGIREGEKVDEIITFGGSALKGESFTNILKLSQNSLNVGHPFGGPSGHGDSQCLAGYVGRGRIVAFGDSNGFTAMQMQDDNGNTQAIGMNTEGYNWKQFVLNTLHWLSQNNQTQ